MINQSFVRLPCHDVVEVFASYVAVLVFISGPEHFFRILVADILTDASDCVLEVINAELACELGVECRENQISLWLGVVFADPGSGDPNKLSKVEHSSALLLDVVEHILCEHTLMVEA